eukprot:5474028-Prorocentrum_lima.AAC.1
MAPGSSALTKRNFVPGLVSHGSKQRFCSDEGFDILDCAKPSYQDKAINEMAVLLLDAASRMSAHTADKE